ncbi:MAG: hypothetical protein H0T84_15450 [Tatlockia sp.]|nr:hypothetical protein [Tatlockia sp.]
MYEKNAIITNTFNTVVKECTRSLTKKNLHINPLKEEKLAVALNKTFKKFGEAVAVQIQSSYEKKNPALSFLFAQISNAVFEKTFYYGSYHSQAAYSLIELSKLGIFNASLMFSHTGDQLTEHYYLLLLDESTLERLQQLPAKTVFIRVNSKSGLPAESLFFDTWSNELCKYKDLVPQNECTKQIKTTDQALFKPFVQLFKNEVNVIENIIWCLNEYEKRLKQFHLFHLVKDPIPEHITQLFTSSDVEFQNEIELLSNSDKCISKLLLTLEDYKKDFQKQLNLLKQPNWEPIEEKVKQKNDSLVALTSSFFKKQLPAQWKIYPEENLVGKYMGHQLRFFTMSQDTQTEKADDFVIHLKENGFAAERRDARSKPSVIVDLTASTLKI